MKTYSKHTANVFLAKCTEKHEKGEIITLTTKYGKSHDCIVFNLIKKDAEGNYYYSIVRADGYNLQERAKAKADRYQSWANSREQKSTEYCKASQEGKDFLVLAEPIKIGHHSEKRHRALIERNHNRMDKCVEESKKAQEHQSKAEYWEGKADEINLSIPESLEYYEYKYEEAKMYHEGLKNGTIVKKHSFSLTYAKKNLNNMESKLKLAKQMWG